MTPEQWEEIEGLFSAGLGLPAADRERFVLSEASDGAVAHRVLAMLRVGAADQPELDEGVPLLRVARSIERDDEQRFLHRGDRVGAFRILRLVATGGMGAVYLAERADGDIRQRVAIKLMRLSRIRKTGEDAHRRFRLERQVLASLTHPNITRLLDVGVTDDAEPYLVMEYVDGLPIDVYCKANRLSQREIALIMAEVCEAVQYAHQNLIQHRDIKPQNILVRSDDVPKILDFGIARLLEPKHAWEEMNTKSGEFIGTLSYAAPEQIRGSVGTDTRGDVYSLGSVLYQTLTGQLPYGDSTNLSTFLAHIEHGSVVPPSEHNPAVSADLNAVVMRAIAVVPDRRFQTAADLAADLRRFAAGEPVIARADSGWYVLRAEIKRRRVPIIAALLVIIASVAVGSLATWQASRLSDRTRELERALHINTLREARLLSAAGNVSATESILWERLEAEDENESLPRLTPWALRELYTRYPIEWTRHLARDRYRTAGSWREGRIAVIDTAQGMIVGIDGADGGSTPICSAPDAVAAVTNRAQDRVAWTDSEGNVRMWDASGDSEAVHIGQVSRGSTLTIADASDRIVVLDSRRASTVGLDGGVTRLGDDAGVLGIAVDHEGGVFGRCDDGTIRRWDAGTGAELDRWELAIDSGRHVLAVDATGRYLLCTSGNSVAVLDTRTDAIRWIVAAQGWVEDARFVELRGGQRVIVAASADYAVRAWDAQTHELKLEATAHRNRPDRIVAMADSGRMISIDRDGVHRLWDLNEHPEHTITYPDSSTVLSFDVDRSEQAVFGALDGDPPRVVLSRFGEPESAESKSFASPVGAVVHAGGTDSCVAATYGGLVMRLQRQEQTLAIAWQQDVGSAVSTAALSPEGDRVAVGHSGGLSVFRVADGRRLAAVPLDCSRVPEVVWAGGSLFAVTLPGSSLVEVIEQTGDVLPVLTTSSRLRTVDVSIDGRALLCAGDDGIVRVVTRTPEGWSQTAELSGHRAGVFDVVFGPHGLAASGARSGVVILWHLDTLTEVGRYDVLPGMVFDLAFVGDQLMVAGSDAVIRRLGIRATDARVSRNRPPVHRISSGL